MRATSKETVSKARKLRRAISPPEAILWNVLRTRPAGLKFRRQHPFGPFILDFYCPGAKRAIEVDGVGHGFGDAPQRDQRRDRWIVDHGLTVMRIPAADIALDVDVVVRGILARCGAVV